MSGSAKQPFPQIGTPFVTGPTGEIAIPWYRFLITLWYRTGGAVAPTISDFFVSLVGNLLGLYQQPATLQGTVVLTSQPGAPAEEQTIVASPQTYIAGRLGWLIVFAAQVELSRDGGTTWYVASLSGGVFPMLGGDRARMTWYRDDPVITWFPMDQL